MGALFMMLGVILFVTLIGYGINGIVNTMMKKDKKDVDKEE